MASALIEILLNPTNPLLLDGEDTKPVSYLAWRQFH